MNKATLKSKHLYVPIKAIQAQSLLAEVFLKPKIIPTFAGEEVPLALIQNLHHQSTRHLWIKIWKKTTIPEDQKW